MINETSKTQRIIMAVVAVIGGIVPDAVAPTQAMQTLKISLDQVLLRLRAARCRFLSRCASPFGYFFSMDHCLCFCRRVSVDACQEIV